jgi:hypothetical protein
MTYCTERTNMFNSTRRSVRLAAVVGTAGVLALALAGPASASTNQNEATGVTATGLVTAGPLSHSQFPGGPSSASLVRVNAAPLLTAGLVNTRAGATMASASVARLSVVLAPLAALSAQVVAANCSFNPDTGRVSGASSIVNAAINLGPLARPIRLAAVAAPNTAITVPGIASVILNRQVRAADGSLTVDAIYVSLLGRTQVIKVSTVHCEAAAQEPIPVVAPIFAASAGLLGLVGAGFYLARRRRLEVTA